jgi:hypothetical protein
MTWEVEGTDEFRSWYLGLGSADQNAIDPVIGVPEAEGPSLGRPLVDQIKASRHAHMKELRIGRGAIRILFAFDPRRCAILLPGGRKQGAWNRWYDEMVPHADDLYDTYLDELRKEELIP